MKAEGHRVERYLPQASLLDVMIEQLRFLVEHQSADCPADCMDCARVGQVRAWLLLPFHSARGRSSSRPAAASSAH